MAEASFRIENMASGVQRLLMGPSGLVLQQVATLQRRVLARAKLTVPVDTGYLRNSHVAPPPTVIGLRVSADVAAIANYAAAVHDGTRARIGARGRTIAARPGRPWLYNSMATEGARMGFTVTRQ